MSVVLHGGPPSLDGESWPYVDGMGLGTTLTIASYLDGYCGQLMYLISQEPNAFTPNWHATYQRCMPFVVIAEPEPEPEVRASELLYRTTDPLEVPLVMPTWARQVPELAALIDEGLKRRAEYPYTDAQRAMMRP